MHLTRSSLFLLWSMSFPKDGTYPLPSIIRGSMVQKYFLVDMFYALLIDQQDGVTHRHLFCPSSVIITSGL